MSIKKIWAREKHRQDSCDWVRRRCDINWPIHREIIFDCFRQFTVEAGRNKYRADNSSGHRRDGSNLDFPVVIGEETISLSELDSRTRQATFYHNGHSEHRSWVLRHGGMLSVHYAYGKGLISAFITPPYSDSTISKREPILIWLGRDTDMLTTELAEKLIRKMLIICRAEGNYEGSRLERIKVRWWRFMDRRNREQTYNEYVPLFNSWEVPIITTALLLVNIALTILLT